MGLPSQAEIVIVGGGIAGCSTAYHLARAGKTDVVLLEQGKLTSGTTWHAAGLVGQMRPNRNMTVMSKYGIELYSTLEAETGLATGWKQCGSVNVARTLERMQTLKKQVAMANSFGVECHLIERKEIGERVPIMRTDDLQGGIWLPGDGKANPADLCMSLAKGARNRGVAIHEGIEVTGVIIEDGKAVGVRTAQGDIRCDVVVNCAGQWARQFGRLAGVNVPLYSAEHFYVVTGKIEGVTPMMPVVRDPDGFIYYKEEVGGLVMGGFEPVAKPWKVDPIPATFQFELLDEDWDQFEPLMTNAIHRTPCLETAEIKMLLNGPESFTPDGNFILGEAPELRNYFVCAGFNSSGIANSGGAGRLTAEWIIRRRAEHRPVGCRHPPLCRFHRQPQGLVRTHGRDTGPALRHALAAPGTGNRTATAHLTAVRHIAGQECGVRQQKRLGARQLFPHRRRRDATVHAGQTTLVALGHRGAARHARNRRHL